MYEIKGKVIDIISTLNNGDVELIKNNSKVYTNGKKFKNTNNEDFVIIGKSSKKENFIIKFSNEVVLEVRYTEISNGGIKNLNTKSFLNIGFIGYGKHKTTINNKKTIEYVTWEKMITRCYNENYKKYRSSYDSVIVDTRWHNFQNFCDDIITLKGHLEWKNKENRYCLDKDILCEKLKIAPKIYSKDTCMFISISENSKESGIRNLKKYLTGLKYKATRIDDGYQEIFYNQTEFSSKYNLDRRCVNGCILKHQNKHRGWTFEKC